MSNIIDGVIARLFHAWERRLHAVSKDRVVRPFEWGLDWIETNGPPPDAPPEKILLDWASRAVSDSTRFFETPDTSDYTFRARRGWRDGRVVVSERDAHAVSGEQHGARAVFRAEAKTSRPTRVARTERRRAGAPFSSFRNGTPGPTAMSACAGC